MRVSFGTRIEPDLKQRVKTYAAATDQTIEDVVEAALSNHLAATTAELPTFLLAGQASEWPQGHVEKAPVLAGGGVATVTRPTAQLPAGRS